MNLIRWQPRSMTRSYPTEAPGLVSEWDRMVNDLFNWAPVGCESSAVSEWVPRADVREEKERYVVDYELPGLEKKDVQVSMDDQVLTVSGERRQELAQEEDKLYRTECHYGKFSRSMRFPDHIDSEKIEAEFKNGMLRVAIPKKDAAKSRSIEIK